MSSEQPDIVSSEQPDIVSSEQPEIVTSSQQSQEAPVADSIVSAISAISEAPSKPDIVSSEQPDIVSSEQPDIVSSEQPDIVSSEQPDIVSSEQPDIVSSEQPEIVTSPQQSQEAPVTDSIFSASSTICGPPHSQILFLRPLYSLLPKLGILLLEAQERPTYLLNCLNKKVHEVDSINFTLCEFFVLYFIKKKCGHETILQM